MIKLKNQLLPMQCNYEILIEATWNDKFKIYITDCRYCAITRNDEQREHHKKKV
jgi:hypothetical protein